MKKESLLLVEDDQHIIDFTRVYLEKAFEVTIAMDGDVALQLFKNNRPKIVLLDLNLPGLDGLDLFREIRHLNPDMPIIIVSARTRESDRVLGLELGADDYVTKPFSGRELLARAKNLLLHNPVALGAVGKESRLEPIPLSRNTS